MERCKGSKHQEVRLRRALMSSALFEHFRLV
jgi:hypothetical protein